MDDIMQRALQLPVQQRLRLVRLLRESLEVESRADEEDRRDLLLADEVRAALKDGREQILTSDELRSVLALAEDEHSEAVQARIV